MSPALRTSFSATTLSIDRPGIVSVASCEGCREPGCDRLRFLDQLPPGHPDDDVVTRRQMGVPRPVAFEVAALGMELEPIHLDNHPLAAPQEVNLVALHLHVGLRPWQAGCPNQAQEPLLRLGAGEGRQGGGIEQRTYRGCADAPWMAGKQGLEPPSGDETAPEGGRKRLLKLERGDAAREVEDRSSGGHHWNPIQDRAFVRRQHLGPMNANARPLREGSTGNRHMHRAGLGWIRQQLPQPGSVMVT